MVASIPKSARRVGRPIVDLAVRGWGQVLSRRGSLRPPVAVAATGRGGSTWLTEVLATVPGHPILWEPLHLGTNPSCRQYGFDWQTYVPVDAQAPRKREYFDALLSGAGLNVELVTSSHFSVREFLRCRALLIKFVNANLLLPWLVRQYELRTALLIRRAAPSGATISQSL
ncbi:MAG: hypothetical protein PVI30_19495 [Myxococcales bacterium]|jgi:hypothetical protein